MKLYNQDLIDHPVTGLTPRPTPPAFPESREIKPVNGVGWATGFWLAVSVMGLITALLL